MSPRPSSFCKSILGKLSKSGTIRVFIYIDNKQLSYRGPIKNILCSVRILNATGNTWLCTSQNKCENSMTGNKSTQFFGRVSI